MLRSENEKEQSADRVGYEPGKIGAGQDVERAGGGQRKTWPGQAVARARRRSLLPRLCGSRLFTGTDFRNLAQHQLLDLLRKYPALEVQVF